MESDTVSVDKADAAGMPSIAVESSVGFHATVEVQVNTNMEQGSGCNAGGDGDDSSNDSESVDFKDGMWTVAGLWAACKLCTKKQWKKCKKEAKKLWKDYRVWQFLTLFFFITTIVFMVLFIVHVSTHHCDDSSSGVSAPVVTYPPNTNDAVVGACSKLVPFECEPRNCTTVQCLEPTGCEYTPVDCGGDMMCNASTNQCEAVNCTGNDPWMCTDDFFLDGACTSKANDTNCDDNDKCTLDYCQPNDEGADGTGCLHIPTNPCGLCDNGKPATCVNNTCECPTCNQMVDMVFVLDSSGSIGANFPSVKEFAQNIAASFLNDPHFGVVSFASTASVVKQLGACPVPNLANKTEQACVQSVIGDLKGPGGRTNTPAALEDATQLFQLAGDRPDVPNVALVFTDGVPNIVGIGGIPNVTCLPFVSETDATTEAAKALQNVSTVIGLGVGIPSDGQCCIANAVCNFDPLGVVQGIASAPVDDNFVAISDFSSLDKVKNRIVSLLCPDAS